MLKPIKTVIIGIVLCLIWAMGCADHGHQAKITVGIVQTASHPALDQAREGFMKTLRDEMGDDVAFIVQNGEGSVSQIRTIVQRFHADRSIDAIYTIGTPATQAAVAMEKEKPVFFAAVTDPTRIGLSEDNQNVTGTLDTIDVPGEIDLLVGLVPQAKTVALMFNPAEVNAIRMKEEMRQELMARHLQVIEVAISQETEARVAATRAVQVADALLAPIDTLIAMTAPCIADIAIKAGKPFFVSDSLLVEKGALAAHGVDYFSAGRETATQALEVLLHGKKIQELPIHAATQSPPLVNPDVLHKLGLSIPKELLGKLSPTPPGGTS